MKGHRGRNKSRRTKFCDGIDTAIRAATNKDWTGLPEAEIDNYKHKLESLLAYLDEGALPPEERNP